MGLGEYLEDMTSKGWQMEYVMEKEQYRLWKGDRVWWLPKHVQTPEQAVRTCWWHLKGLKEVR